MMPPISQEAGQVTGGKPKVLVIDDTSEKRSRIKGALEDRGYAVDEAFDGDDGIRKYIPGRYAVVVCDQRMPGKYGEKVIPEIKKMSPNQPVVMFSKDVGGFTDEQKKAIGADEYVNPTGEGNMWARLGDAVNRLAKLREKN